MQEYDRMIDHENRITSLEHDVKGIKADINEIKTDQRHILSSLRTLDRLQKVALTVLIIVALIIV